MYLEHERTCCWCSFQHEFKNKIFPNGHMWYDIHVENILDKKRSSRNLAVIGITEKKTAFLDNLVDTIIKLKEQKIIFIAYKHGAGQFYFQL